MNSPLIEYGDHMARIFDADIQHFFPNITFQTTTGCNLRCSYCYQHNKGSEVMSAETGKKIIDLLLQMWVEDKPDNFLSKYTKGIVMEFIGGEPLLNPEIIDEILAYFIYKCEEIGCPWIDYFRVSLCTNGVNYFEPKVQNLLKKYKHFISLNVTIDGDKEQHDSCRVDSAGNGSFDSAIKAFHSARHYWGKGQTKITLVPETIPTAFKSAKFLIESGATEVSMNCAYEPLYTTEDGQKLFNQLKQLADWLIDNRNDTYVTMLGINVGDPLSESETLNFCGGNGQMICFTPNGNAYPCLRFAETSLSKEMAEAVRLGNTDGLYNTPETLEHYNRLQHITRMSQSTDECIHCPVASECGWCTANNYDITGNPDKRVTNICNVHKSRALAVCYYYNKRYLEIGDCMVKKVNLPKEDALNYITEDEWDEIKNLEKAAILKSFVNYCVDNPDYNWEIELFTK